MTTQQLSRRPPASNAAQASPDIGGASTAYNLTPDQRVQTATEIVLAARQAWVRLKQARSWTNWVAVGAGLMVLRAEAMKTANTARPEGRRYNEEFSDLLAANGLDDIDKAARSCLYECIANRAAIEAWRAKLKDDERLRWNHPQVVLHHWQRTKVKKPDAPKKPSAFAQLRAANLELHEENMRLEREVRTGGGDLWRADDRPQDIARVLVATLPPNKLQEIWRHVRSLLKAKAQP